MASYVESLMSKGLAKKPPKWFKRMGVPMFDVEAYDEVITDWLRHIVNVSERRNCFRENSIAGCDHNVSAELLDDGSLFIRLDTRNFGFEHIVEAMSYCKSFDCKLENLNYGYPEHIIPIMANHESKVFILSRRYGGVWELATHLKKSKQAFDAEEKLTQRCLRETQELNMLASDGDW